LEIKDLGIIEIVQKCTKLIDESFNSVEDNSTEETSYDKYNIWRAYSWVEYCILLVRLHKYNLLDQPSSEFSDNQQQQQQQQTKSSKTKTKTKKTKIKLDEKVMLQQVKDLLLNLNYNNEEKLVEDLRSSRDILKQIFKDRKKKFKKKVEQ
jgi:hypothetical protein